VLYLPLLKLFYVRLLQLLLTDKGVSPQVGVRYAGKNGHAKTMRILLKDSRVALQRADFEVATAQQTAHAFDREACEWSAAVIWEMIGCHKVQRMMMKADPSVVPDGAVGGALLRAQLRKQCKKSTWTFLLCLGSDEWRKKASKTNDIVHEILAEWAFWR
jgi:hypothetical protein